LATPDREAAPTADRAVAYRAEITDLAVISPRTT
jgi:hypothetical protein